MHWLNKYPGPGPDQGSGARFGFSYSIGNGARHPGCQEQQLPRGEHPAWESKGSQTLASASKMEQRFRADCLICICKWQAYLNIIRPTSCTTLALLPALSTDLWRPTCLYQCQRDESCGRHCKSNPHPFSLGNGNPWFSDMAIQNKNCLSQPLLQLGMVI